MPRALFEKTGGAVWISHLDLMRLFQRGFQRAGVPLRHTQGFTPRPIVSIALPLSVGVESLCELLDFSLEGEGSLPEGLAERLNAKLTPGIRVREIYEGGKKIGDLAELSCQILLEYDRGVPKEAEKALTALFARDSLPVERKTKSGPQEQDIAPMLRSLSVRREGERLALDARVCCQNPTLNPVQLVRAVERYCPEYAPDFFRCRRLEIYDKHGEVFR